MKRIILFLLMMSLSTPMWAEECLPKVQAKGAILIEQESGRVLFEKNAEEPLPMASTTKIMTCILAIEKGKLDDIVTVSKRASLAPPVKLHLKQGEKQRLGDLLYALMLQSDNDVAVAVAEHIGGTVEHFCEMMTEKAKEIGAEHTCFKTPNGLDAEGHVASAHDMAIIAAYAMKNPTFVKVVTTTNIKIPTQTTEHSRIYDLQCKNRFIYTYQGANGIKTGFTSKAGHCFVGGANRNDMQLIAVALGSGWGSRGKTQKYTDVIRMMNYGFNQYHMVNVIKPVKGVATVKVQKAIQKEVSLNCDALINLPLTNKEAEELYIKTVVPTELVAPIKQGQEIGHIEVVCSGVSLAKAPLYAGYSVHKATLLDHVKEWLSQF